MKKNIVIYESEEKQITSYVRQGIEIAEKNNERYDSYVWTKIDVIKDRIICPFLRYYPERQLNDGIHFSQSDIIQAGTKSSWLNQDQQFVNIEYDEKNWMNQFQPTKDLFMINYLIESKKICIKDGVGCGLGNLLFYIASSFGYSIKTKRVFFMANNPVMTTSAHSNVNYENTLFKYFVKYDTTKINNITYFNEQRFDTCIKLKNDNLISNCQLHGYLQNENYFIHIRDEILQIFDQLYEETNQEINYFIHVRRGDYVNNKYHEMNLKKYYNNSIQYIKNNDSGWRNKKFVVVSDGIDWCIENKIFQSHDLKISYIKNMNEIETLKLMINAKNGGIASNSTFSWWGLWLNKNHNAFKILPAKWFPIKKDPLIQFAGAILMDL